MAYAPITGHGCSSVSAHNAEYVRAYEAFQDLAMRLWCGDAPEEMTVPAIDAWAAGLPEDECAALNAMLGEAFSRRLDWDGDHPISVVVLARATERIDGVEEA
jgi:hypothetical protein